MATYKDSGVDIELGDACSKLAYEAAKATFASRKGMIGEPVTLEGGFAGLLDMGDFYLVQNDDGVGTKIEVAERMNKFDTLGYDLIAMVADDAICLGAETISVTNTLDAPKLNKDAVEGLMAGLQKAANEQKIVIPGGELAELGNALNGMVWNATAVGIVKKEDVMTGKDIEAGDAVIGLKSDGIRSNGLSLARHILKEAFGEAWTEESFGDSTWGDTILTPCKIYSRSLLNIRDKVNIKGLAHNTGGGIKGNLPRILKDKNLGAKLDNLIEPHEFMTSLMEFGNVEREEAYKTWNMGIGMFMIVAQEDTENAISLLKEKGIEAQKMGEVKEGAEIEF